MFVYVVHLAGFPPTGLQLSIALRFTKVHVSQVGYLLFPHVFIPKTSFAQLPRQHSAAEQLLGLPVFCSPVAITLTCTLQASALIPQPYPYALHFVLRLYIFHYFMQKNYLLLWPSSYKHVIAITVIPHSSTRLNKILNQERQQLSGHHTAGVTAKQAETGPRTGQSQVKPGRSKGSRNQCNQLQTSYQQWQQYNS